MGKLRVRTLYIPCTYAHLSIAGFPVSLKQLDQFISSFLTGPVTWPCRDGVIAHHVLNIPRRRRIDKDNTGNVLLCKKREGVSGGKRVGG